MTPPGPPKRPFSKPFKPYRGGYAPGRASPRQPPVFDDNGPVRLFGVHPVEAALGNQARKLIRISATENAERRLAEAISARGLTVERVSPRDLDLTLGGDTVHQGVMLECEQLDEPELQELIESSTTGGPLIVLDQVTDPHNAGAILRSAAAFGASGVVMTRRHSPPLNGTLAKAASGALEWVPIAMVQNLAKTLQELKDQGALLLGLDSAAPSGIEEEAFSGPVAIVMGAEGKGLRQLTAETCTRLVSVSTAGTLASLNVSNAAAIALHVALMKRKVR
ncbi:MAG: 23S rRNA (guanosine(2251)-2'-O)-methyltransferase RlmB [Hyphomicrobium sp.]